MHGGSLAIRILRSFKHYVVHRPLCLLVSILIFFCVYTGALLALSAKSSVTDYVNNKDWMPLVEQIGRSVLADHGLDNVYLYQLGTHQADGSKLSKLIIDVSNHKVMSLVLPRLFALPSDSYENYVVDFGAYDGILGSNAFNLIRKCPLHKINQMTLH